MNRDEAFELWYDEYFCDTQGEDSPYSYNDVKIAFYSGWKKHKEANSGWKKHKEAKKEVFDDIEKCYPAMLDEWNDEWEELRKKHLGKINNEAKER
ncbi:MAG: hypothetical protein PHQ60_16275 [Sideroxydans sp.]|nr:hypothetical protein [Sideroxydans sp.]